MIMSGPEARAPLSDLPRRQLVDDLLACRIVEHHPAADLLDGALAAEAEAALGVERADADAGRHDASQGRRPITHRRHPSGFLAEFRELVLQLVELALEVVD